MTSISNRELVSRLQHLANVLEITCLNSSRSDFTHSSFSEARAYDSRVLSELETGVKDWLTLDRSIDSTCWQFARQLHEANSFTPEPQEFSPNFNNDLKKCTSWDLFCQEDCQFEFLNPGCTCKFMHSCSICEANGMPGMPHKALYCPDNQSDSDHDSSFTDVV